MYFTPNSRLTSCTFAALPLYVKVDVRAMTKRSGSLEREVIKSSVMPSLKYSWSRSPLMLVKGNTAIEGLSGKRRAGGCAGGMDADGVGGRKERCCTNMMVAAMIANPAIEKT